MFSPCYRFEATHFLPRPRAELWPFFVDPHNLAKIMPPELGMRCDPDRQHDICHGLALRRRVRRFPLANAPGGAPRRDLVHYVVPGGPLARLIDRWNVRPRLERIFAHRRVVLEQLFPAPG